MKQSPLSGSLGRVEAQNLRELPHRKTHAGWLRGQESMGETGHQPERCSFHTWFVNQGSKPMVCDTIRPRVERTLPTGWRFGKPCAMQSWFLALASFGVTWA